MIPSDPVTLNALRVHTPSITVSSGHGTYRPATLDDLIEVFEGMGAKRVWWCEEHERPGHRNACSARVKVAACPMVACLVLPLPTPQSDQ